MLRTYELGSHRKTWKKLKCILLSEMATSCMLPTIWHSGKGKITEAVKRSMVTRCLRVEKNELVVHRGVLGQWNCLIWFQNKDYMSLFISHNTENIQHQDWTQSRLWVFMICQCIFISCDRYIPLRCGILMVGEVLSVCGRGYVNTLYFPLSFSVNLKL